MMDQQQPASAPIHSSDFIDKGSFPRKGLLALRFSEKAIPPAVEGDALITAGASCLALDDLLRETVG